MQPILLNSCNRAATAEEARFRIDAPIPRRDGARVIALDGAAAIVIRRLAHRSHGTTRLLTIADDGVSSEGTLVVRRLDGTDCDLADELADADLVVMVATPAADPVAAATIADGCSGRGIVTAGIVLESGRRGGPALNALRPHARVLMFTHDDSDVAEVLAELRA
jgi:hypothetical protein